MILGASGNICREIVSAFHTYNTGNPSSTFKITILTREASYNRTLAQFPPSSDIQVVPISSYTDATALTSLLQKNNIQVLISTIATFSTKDQQTIVNACVAAGTVQRFVPSEYGVDTSNIELITKHLPPALLKNEVVSYLRQVSADTNGQLTWSAIIVGTFFDWGLLLPGVMSYDVPKMSATVFDGGDVKYEGTNVGHIARAVVACLATPEAFEATTNEYVYVNSFTTTQNEVIGLIEKFTGRTMQHTPVSSTDLGRKARETMEAMGGLEAYRAYEPTPEAPYAPGSVEAIWSCLYGGNATGGLNQYSLREPGLWNARLGLPKEKIEETVRGVVANLGMLKDE